MQALVYVFLACLFSVDWLSDKLNILPNEIAYFAELMAISRATTSARSAFVASSGCQPKGTVARR